MLENLINLVRGQSNEAIVNNPAIPNERNEEAIRETGSSIIDSLKKALSGGGLQSVIGMFANGKATPENPVVRDASSSVIDKLKQRFGLSEESASGIAGNVVPNVMNQLAQKTADPSDKGFDIQDIFNQLSGGKTSGMNLGSLVNRFRGGLDRDGDGDTDLQDLKALFSGTAR
jgi:hypothetical protein